MGALCRLDHAQQCELLYFDESSFSPKSTSAVRRGKDRESRRGKPLSHRQRVNMLGALRDDGFVDLDYAAVTDHT